MMREKHRYPSKARREAKAAILEKAVRGSRWPFKVRIVNVLGLWGEGKGFAHCDGVFDIVLELDTNLYVTAPAPVSTFCLYHEVTHAIERHGFQRVLARWLLGAALAIVCVVAQEWWLGPAVGAALLPGAAFCLLALRGYHEARADQAAARTLSAENFGKALFCVWNPPRKGWRGIGDRIVYGRTPEERALRAGITIERW